MMRYVAAAFRNIGKTPFFVVKLFAWCAIVGVAGVVSVLTVFERLNEPLPALIGVFVIVFGLLPLAVLPHWLLRYYVTDGRHESYFHSNVFTFSKAQQILGVIVLLTTLFFVLPGVYVFTRLQSYLPRVARGDDPWAALEDAWEDGSGQFIPRLAQGSIYALFSSILVAAFAVPGVLLYVRSAELMIPSSFASLFAGGGSLTAFFIAFIAKSAFMAGVIDEDEA